MILQLLVVALAVPGIISIVLSKKSTKAQHMYSVHAWTGAIQLLLMLSQVNASRTHVLFENFMVQANLC